MYEKTYERFACPFCAYDALFEVTHMPATPYEPAGGTIDCVDACEHADTIDELFEALEAAANGDSSAWYQWEELAFQTACELEVEIASDLNIQATRTKMSQHNKCVA